MSGRASGVATALVAAVCACAWGPAHGSQPTGDRGPLANDHAAPSDAAVPADVDNAYLEMMALYHELALDIARIGVERAHRDAVRRFARRLATETEQDLEDLRKAYPERTEGRWSVDAVTAARIDDPDTQQMLQRLGELQGSAFDQAFTSVLIAHHDMAMHVLKGKGRFKSPVLKAHAERVLKRQERDLKALETLRRGFSP